MGEFFKFSFHLSVLNCDFRKKDHAAGCLIVEEAGGTVTDFQGKPLDFSVGRTLSKNRGVLASSKLLHPQVLKAVQQAVAESEVN